MKVLITGSKGKLGSLVKKRFKELNIGVIEFHRKTTIDEVRFQDFEFIVHLASRLPKKGGTLKEFWKDNVKLTNEMIKLAKDKRVPILITNTYSMFYRYDEYSFTKAVTDSLINEYRNKVKIYVLRLPYIKYEDNIFTQIEDKRQKEEVIVDELDMQYIESYVVVKQIENIVLGFNTYDLLTINNVNLYSKFKDKPNVKKGEKKSFAVKNSNDDISLNHKSLEKNV